MVQDGEPEGVIAEYEEAALAGRSRDIASGERAGRHVNVVAEIASVRLLNSAGEEIGAAPTAEDVSYTDHGSRSASPARRSAHSPTSTPKRVAVFRTAQQDEVLSQIGAACSTWSCGFPRICSPRRPTRST